MLVGAVFSTSVSSTTRTFIRPVLTQDHRHFSKNTIHYRMLRQVMGNGLVTNDGPDWVRQRRLIQPAFASRRLARFDQTINALTSSLLARWERQDPAEAVWIDREMSALTFDIVGETLFGRDIKEHAREMRRSWRSSTCPAATCARS